MLEPIRRPCFGRGLAFVYFSPPQKNNFRMKSLQLGTGHSLVEGRRCQEPRSYSIVKAASKLDGRRVGDGSTARDGVVDAD